MGASNKCVAIVTGASRGIGRAIAARLARDGHAVTIVQRARVLNLTVNAARGKLIESSTVRVAGIKTYEEGQEYPGEPSEAALAVTAPDDDSISMEEVMGTKSSRKGPASETKAAESVESHRL